MHFTKINYSLMLSGLLLTLVGYTFFAFSPKVSAMYDGGRLIDDMVFLNTNTMTESDIHNFIVNKGGGIANMSFVFDCTSTGMSAQYYQAAGAPCGQTVRAATIIYYAAQIYGMNPQVILATMQKEQSVVTAPNPTTWQVNQAMGYGCPDSGGCGASNFLYQIDNGVWTLRYHMERARGNMDYWFHSVSWVCGTTKNYYSPSLYPYQNVNFYDDNGTLYRTHYIANPSTSSFYCYTPHAYNNPQGLYGLPTYGTTGQYYSGSYNFVKYFETWFGSTYAYIYNGTSYADVFNAQYYLNKYPDVLAVYGSNPLDVFKHFINHGMSEGRQGSANFDVVAYRNGNADLRWAYGTNLPSYYSHYIVVGKKEGRSATSPVILQPVTVYNGVDYSTIYDFNAYLSNNGDLRAAYSNDDTGALWHFVKVGMGEGRVSNSTFDVTSYRKRYPDLRNAFGTNIRLYYLHYMSTGAAEHRIATGDFLGGTTVLNSVDYSAVYNPDFYQRQNPDIQKTFGTDDVAMLRHFVNYGMAEGRQGNDTFNVSVYKSTNGDLRIAFGSNLKDYYMHYITTGKSEGRTAI